MVLMDDHTDDRAAGSTVLVVGPKVPAHAVAVRMIADAGNRVVEAPNAAVALQLMSRGLTPDLLITSVTLLGSINGFALAHIVATRWPHISILICSGHETPRPGDMPPGATFLHEPYLPNTLLDRIAALSPAD